MHRRGTRTGDRRPRLDLDVRGPFLGIRTTRPARRLGSAGPPARLDGVEAASRQRPIEGEKAAAHRRRDARERRAARRRRLDVRPRRARGAGLARAAALLLRHEGAPARRGRPPRLRPAHGRASTPSSRAPRSADDVLDGARPVAQGDGRRRPDVHHADLRAVQRSRGATRRSRPSSPSCCAARASTWPACSRRSRPRASCGSRAGAEAVADVLFSMADGVCDADADRARPRLRAVGAGRRRGDPRAHRLIAPGARRAARQARGRPVV